MTFLSPLLLWVILPFVAMPIIIHLVNRMRYQPMNWAAMDFLFSAKRSSTRFAKLREKIILACRCLAIFCLAMALSRPRSGGWLGWSFGNSLDTVIIVLDRSSSMAALDESGQKNKLFITIEMIQESAAQMPSGTRFVLVDSAAAKARTLKSLDVLNDPLLFDVTDTTCNMSELLQVAYDYIDGNTPGETQIWMTGDLQYSNWDPDNRHWKVLNADFESLTDNVSFRMLALSHKVKENTSVTLDSVSRYQQGKKNFLQLKLHLQRNYQSSASLPITLKLNGNESVQDVSMSARTLDYTYNVELPEDDKGGFGYVAIPQDKQPGDNIYYFAYADQQPLKTAILAKGVSGKILNAAAAPFPGTNQQAQNIENSQLLLTLSDKLSLVIVAGKDLNSNEEKQLQEFIKGGGQLLLFPPLKEEHEIFSLITPGVLEQNEKDFFPIEHWDGDLGVLANSSQGEKMPLDKLNISRRQTSSQKGEVLATFSDGQPFLSRYGLGKGSIYYCATGVPQNWSDLYKGAVLLPLLDRLQIAGAQQYSAINNANCQIREFSEHQVIEGDKHAVYQNLHAGVYKSDRQILVLNRPASEAVKHQVSGKVLKKLFGDLQFAMFNEKTSRSERKVQTELFPMFAFLILLFLGVEGFMTLRRVPLREDVK